MNSNQIYVQNDLEIKNFKIRPVMNEIKFAEIVCILLMFEINYQKGSMKKTLKMHVKI